MGEGQRREGISVCKHFTGQFVKEYHSEKNKHKKVQTDRDGPNSQHTHTHSYSLSFPSSQQYIEARHFLPPPPPPPPPLPVFVGDEVMMELLLGQWLISG